MTRTFATAFISFGLVLCLPLGAAQNAPVKKPTVKNVAKPATSAKSKSKAKTKISAKNKKPAVTHASQQHPAPERIVEIQQALVDRGYLMEATGTWGPESVAALKKFQQEQGLPVDGKLGALSLTGLGLGPRRGGSVADAITAGILQIGSATVPLD